MKIIKPLTFNPFTFSRASEAQFLDASGLIETASNDVLRNAYAYDADTDTLSAAGPLIESAAINYIAASNTFEAWTASGTPSPTITDNDDVSPSGATDAASFFPGGIGTQLISMPTYWTPGGGPAVFSVFVKAIDTNMAIRLNFYTTTSVFRINVGDYEAFEDNARITPYPDGWFRCEIYLDSTFTSTPQIQAVSGASFLMWGAQVEPGTTASSPIVGSGYSVVDTSGTAVTRVSGTAFTDYSEGQSVYIAYSPTGATFVIDTITDADNMTLTTTTGATQTGKGLYPRWERAADVVISQTPSLVSSNIAEDDADVWGSGDSYVIGDKVMVLGEYHRVYEALENNANKFPPENTIDQNPTDPDWLDTGATNRWQMFDMSVGAEKQSLSTVSSGNIDVTVQVDVPVNSVVLLNASGSIARITMRNGSAEVIYEREVNLLGTAMGIGWWEFFFGYRSGVKTIVLTDLPKIAPATIQLEIESGGGVAGLGKFIIGEAIEIGCARFGTTVGIIDFSRKERDAFGNNYILERRYIDKVDYDIQIDSDKVDDVKDILSDIRATPAVYIGSENKFKSTVVYGFYRDFSIVIAGSKKSSCAIQVEGI